MIADWTRYELLVTLEVDGWQWAAWVPLRLRTKKSIPIPDAFRNGEPKNITQLSIRQRCTYKYWLHIRSSREQNRTFISLVLSLWLECLAMFRFVLV